jgi:putative oxidoreductase
MKKELITSILASLLIFLFLYTGFDKISDSKGFQSAMNMQPLSGWMIKVLLKTLPATEIAVSLLLIFPRTRLAGFYASTILMTSFSIYIAMGILHVFKYVPCSCAGVFRHMTWPHHLLLNIGFLADSIIGILACKRSPISEKNPVHSKVRYT